MPSTRFSFLSEYKTALAVVGGLISAMSVISLVAKYWAGGLAPIASEYLEYYRSVISFAFKPIAAILPFSIPGWYKDLFVISLMLTTSFGRAHRSLWPLTRAYNGRRTQEILASLTPEELAEAQKQPPSEFVTRISRYNSRWYRACSYVLSHVLLLNLLNVPAMLLFYGSYRSREPDNPLIDVPKYFLISLSATIAATIAFFAINYQLS